MSCRVPGLDYYYVHNDNIMNTEDLDTHNVFHIIKNLVSECRIMFIRF